MSEAQTETEEVSRFQGSRFAHGLGLALVGGLAIVVTCGAIDRGQRAEIETVEQLTAAGDTRYFTAPATLPDPPKPVMILGAKLLFLVESKTHSECDAEMIRLGRDSESGLAIYELRETAKEKRGGQKQGEGFYFLKTAPGEYVKLRVGK